MKIRELIEDDLEALLDLYKHLHDSDTPAPARRQIEEVWRAIIADNKLKYLGAFDAGRLVSTCNLALIPNLTRSCRSYGLIENVVTHPDFRRRGFGAAVLKAALQLAWSKGCYKVMLMTGRLDEETFSFYESAGFKRNEKQAFIAKPEHP